MGSYLKCHDCGANVSGMRALYWHHKTAHDASHSEAYDAVAWAEVHDGRGGRRGLSWHERHRMPERHHEAGWNAYDLKRKSDAEKAAGGGMINRNTWGSSTYHRLAGRATNRPAAFRHDKPVARPAALSPSGYPTGGYSAGGSWDHLNTAAGRQQFSDKRAAVQRKNQSTYNRNVVNNSQPARKPYDRNLKNNLRQQQQRTPTNQPGRRDGEQWTKPGFKFRSTGGGYKQDADGRTY